MSKKSIRTIAITLVFVLVIVLVVFLGLKRFGVFSGKPGAEVKEGDTFLLKLEKKSPDGTDVCPFRVTIHNTEWSDSLDDTDGYYAKLSYMEERKKLEEHIASVFILFDEDIRYLTIDMTVECLELSQEEREALGGEAAYNLKQLYLYNVYDNGEKMENTCDLVDYKVVEGSDNVSASPANPFLVTIEEGTSARIRLLYLWSLDETGGMYNPCVNLANEDPEGQYFFEDCFVNLGLDVYETPYSLSASADSERYSKATVSVQEREAANNKANSRYLNPACEEALRYYFNNNQYEDAESYISMSIPDEYIASGEEPARQCYLSLGGTIDESRTYYIYSDISVSVYDTLGEMPEHFASSEALQKIKERYVKEFGYKEEDIKYLQLSAEHTSNPFYDTNLQNLWFYDRSPDGMFHPYGYADDYWIAESTNKYNDIPHSSIVYAEPDDVTSVEIALVLYPGYNELYFSPLRLGPLHQEMYDGVPVPYVEIYQINP